MALTGCTETIIKEFNYLPGGTCTRLVQGFKDEAPAYYAIFQATGLNLPLGDAEYGRITEVSTLNCEPANYEALAKKFKDIVSPML